jgi:hypothetical protein
VFAGRAAAELRFGEYTSGGQSDQAFGGHGTGCRVDVILEAEDPPRGEISFGR